MLRRSARVRYAVARGTELQHHHRSQRCRARTEVAIAGLGDIDALGEEKPPKAYVDDLAAGDQAGLATTNL